MSNPTTHVSASGGLLTQSFIENIREANTQIAYTKPTDFTVPWADVPRTERDLDDHIATAWELLLERWDAIRADFDAMDVSEVRQRWLMPFFNLLDFNPEYQRGDVVLGEADALKFPLSHRGWTGDDAPVLHMVAPGQDLDERQSVGRGVKAKSPHDMLQVFLNVSTDDLWAVLTNGRLLRLLRDYHHTFSKGYVQFDLESIFETRNYSDFQALYRMCHASRFRAVGQEGDERVPPNEAYYKAALATGVKIGQDLRAQVRTAIELLGNGLLDADLIETLQDDTEACQQFYSEVLRVVYRMLFLLFAEQRGLMPRDGAELEWLYRQAYSMTALRMRAEDRIPERDHNVDLWQGLVVTFDMVRTGDEAMGIFAYNGELFDTSVDELLADRSCDNSRFLKAVRELTLIERDGAVQRISYLDLGVEELGSIYESLLDFTPRVTAAAETVDGRDIPANTFYLDPRGLDRKQTGSYYTHPSLVGELIRSALLPVMRDRLEEAELPITPDEDLGKTTAGLLTEYATLTDNDRTRGVEALLSMTVCDPAAGSGHFLVQANNVLGLEVARLRTGDDYPSDDALQGAKRDVLARCIYGVDLNPMAVELCKVALWINASVRNRPLNFLDHHIKCGNSLVGTTPELLKEGIPYEAFALGRSGDDREVAKRFRKDNRTERREAEKGDGVQLAFRVTLIGNEEEAEEWLALNKLADEKPSLARERYAAYLSKDSIQSAKLEADLWTAAFFWPMLTGTAWAPTYKELALLQQDGVGALPKDGIEQVIELADTHRFFHWHLEFPGVFSGDSGFDVVLGNPPWERIKVEDNEFFADKDSSIAGAGTTAKRKALIKKLPDYNPLLFQAYQTALHRAECLSTFLRESGCYPLTAAGDIDTYQIFAGLVRRLTNSKGRVGIILPTGIATNYYTQNYFSKLINCQELVSLYDFSNRARLFNGVTGQIKFCLLTLSGTESPTQIVDFAFFLTQVDQLADDERHFTLTREELRQINPNTGTCPTFRTKRDAELTKKLYRAAPVLVNEETGKNPWGVSFQRMFDMSTDSDLFHTREELEEEGFELRGNRFVRGEETYLPLYEAKMLHQFDHRFATYRDDETIRNTTQQEHSLANLYPQPWHWVEDKHVARGYGWRLAFRDIARSTDIRTGIFSIIPEAAVGNGAPLLLLGDNVCAGRAACLLANLNCMSFDFAVRQKVGGTHLNFYIVKQFPVLIPDAYTSNLLSYIAPRVLELTYTAWDVAAFADDVWRDASPDLRAAIGEQWEANLAATGGGHANSEPPEWLERVIDPLDELLHGELFPYAPFMWDETRRTHIRAELDALYAHRYGLERDELAYILDTFPIVRSKDEEQHGEYRTKRLILDAYDTLPSLGILPSNSRLAA